MKARTMIAALGALCLMGCNSGGGESGGGGNGTTTALAGKEDMPAPTCALSPADFKSWQNGASTGLAFAPPDSAVFAAKNNCDFYKWSAQMFLWLTSTNASGTLTMFSPSFYNAIESTSTGGFTLVQNHEGVGAAKVSSVVFLPRVNKPRLLRLRAPGAAKSSDATGQAGGGVLLVNGAPVSLPGKPGYATYPVAYYAIQVNDVFAGLQANQTTVPYYTSGASAGDFPTTLPQAQEIQTAAGKTYGDINQLALEVKSAWVETAYLTPAQASGLITLTAQVPAFTQSTDPKGNLLLSWDGKTTAARKIALVGMHVVGSVVGHPEMIWASFETNFNAPDNDYSFINQNFTPATGKCASGSCLTSVPLSKSNMAPTIFYNGTAGAPAPPFLIAQTASSSNNNTTITSVSPKLVPTNVVRMNPWGSQQPVTPSLTNAVILNNTDLLSLKTTLQPQLTAAGGPGAMLANYFLLGSLWSNGIIPPLTGSTQAGSLFLANTTMETFQQVSPQNHDPKATAKNCFSCHGDFANVGTGVSHVFPNVTN